MWTKQHIGLWEANKQTNKDSTDNICPPKTNKSIIRKERTTIQYYKYDKKIRMYKVAQKKDG